MNYENRDSLGMYKPFQNGSSRIDDKDGPGPHLMGANTLTGNNVYNRHSAPDLRINSEVVFPERANDSLLRRLKVHNEWWRLSYTKLMNATEALKYPACRRGLTRLIFHVGESQVFLPQRLADPVL